MKKALLAIVLLLAFTMVGSAQEYWNIKTSLKGIDVMPSDGNGMGFGAAGIVYFGVPDGKYDIGFEAAKWWRSHDESSQLIQDLINDGDLTRDHANIEVDQTGLKFSILGKHRIFSIMSDGRLAMYAGVGTGFYFLQESREEARLNPSTGIWEVENVDKYLETKAQSFMILGFDGDIFNNLNFFLEGRFTYLFDWDHWDSPYEIGSGLGLRYDF